jgi:hypothetical protein
MEKQLEFIAVVIFCTAVIAVHQILGNRTLDFGFAHVLSIIFLCLSVWIIYWVFITPNGKAFARKYNSNQKKIIEKQALEIKEYRRTKAEVFNDLKNFLPSYSVFSFDCKTAISIDNSSKKVCLLSNPKINALGFFDTRIIERKIIAHRDILEVTIFEDGNSVTTTSRTSQVAGAIVGNIALGGAGLIIGALTGAKKTSATVSSLEVRLTINNIQSPIWSIAFIKSETSKKSSAYQKATNDANKLLGLLKILIKRADDEDKMLESKRDVSSSLNKEQKIDVLAIAKSLDSAAIASLLNDSFNEKEITVQVKIKGNTIKISLASENSPDLDRLVPIIHKKIMELSIDSIENVDISGYQLGESLPSWSKTLQI